VPDIRTGRAPPGAHHLVEPLVGGDLPPHGHLHRRHRLERHRVRRQARPQHDRVGQRVARRHAELERIGGQRRRPANATTARAQDPAAGADRDAHPCEGAQEGAAVDLPAQPCSPVRRTVRRADSRFSVFGLSDSHGLENVLVRYGPLGLPPITVPLLGVPLPDFR